MITSERRSAHTPLVQTTIVCTQLAFNNRHCSVPYPPLLHPTASSENKRLNSIDLPKRTNSFINCSSSNSHAFYFTLPTTTSTPSPPNSRFGCLHQPTNETTKTKNRKSDPSSFTYKKTIAYPSHRPPTTNNIHALPFCSTQTLKKKARRSGRDSFIQK